ncbi:hypothetical protein [Arthrobacter sp. HLT1-21]
MADISAPLVEVDPAGPDCSPERRRRPRLTGQTGRAPSSSTPDRPNGAGAVVVLHHPQPDRATP